MCIMMCHESAKCFPEAGGLSSEGLNRCDAPLFGPQIPQLGLRLGGLSYKKTDESN